MSNVYPAGFTLLLGAKFPLQQVQISSPRTQPFLGSLGASFHLPQGGSISPAMWLPMGGGNRRNPGMEPAVGVRTQLTRDTEERKSSQAVMAPNEVKAFKPNRYFQI